jgi:ABC-type spermidine/putrescine transport system permease subunit II
MSILYLISGVSLRTLASLGGTPAAKAWGTTWFILSVAVNVLVTSLICLKLIRAQRRLRRVLNEESVQVYTSIVAILVESALPFTVLGIVAGVINALGYQISSAFDEAWFAFCVRSLISNVYPFTIYSSCEADLTPSSFFHD